MRIRNYYFLTAGILAVLFAATHAWNGYTAVLPALDGGAVAVETETVFTYVWHIITAENLIFGIAFLLMAFHREPSQLRFAVWMIAVILAVRLAVILGATAVMDASSLLEQAADPGGRVVIVRRNIDRDRQLERLRYEKRQLVEYESPGLRMIIDLPSLIKAGRVRFASKSQPEKAGLHVNRYDDIMGKS